MSGVDLMWFVVGLVVLIGGAEALVRGSSRLALALGMTPLVVGLTVVAFGTSAPEAAIGWMAALRGESGLAVGNVVGSNIFNILVVLGLSAAVAPLAVAPGSARVKTLLMLGASVVTVAMALDGRISPLDGVLLLLGLVGYTVLALRSNSSGEKPPSGLGRRTVLLGTGLTIVGLALLVAGSRALVSGAGGLARSLGVSELVIGLTIVAGGTSLPEVATSLVAALRGQRDIAVGNAIGSCLLNLLLVLGLTAVAAGGLPVPSSAIQQDLPVMVATAVVCLPLFVTGNRVSRWAGSLLFASYAVYLTWLIHAASVA